MKIKVEGKIKDVKLPKRFKNKWVKALRSGEFKQGKNELYSSISDTYCCLGVCGVICSVHISSMDYVGLFSEDWESSFTSDEFKAIPKLLKGSCESDDYDYNIIVAKLTKMNDNGKTFKQIAAYINRYL